MDSPEWGQLSTTQYRLKDGVAFTHARITSIITRVLPHQSIQDIRKDDDGGFPDIVSYSVTIAIRKGGRQQVYTLKIAGQTLGPERIHNEVASLCFLERYCSELPVPRVIGWCQDKMGRGRLHVIKRPPSHHFVGIQSDEQPEIDDGSTKRGWILLTKRPGRPLHWENIEDETVENEERIMKEIAGLSAKMRQKLPTKYGMGNIHLSVSRHIFGTPEDCRASETLPFDFRVGGVLEHINPDYSAILSANDYYHSRISDRLESLKSLCVSDGLAPSIVKLPELVKYFHRFILPELLQLLEQGPPTFTQVRFFAENFLICGLPPTITGLVNFEFAGFFPPEVEFFSDHYTDEKGISGPYDLYLKEMERLGVKTPLAGYSKQEREVYNLLAKLINSVAAWCTVLDKYDICRKKEPGQPQDAGESAIDTINQLQLIVFHKRVKAWKGWNNRLGH